MKKLNFSPILLLFITFLALSVTSCKTEGCTDPEGVNYDADADEDDGTCTYARDPFIGAFNVNENCDSGNYNYTMSVAESGTSVSDIVLNNFGDFGVNVRATVSGSNISFNDTQNGISFSGSGSLSGSTLTIIYTASQAGYTDSCTKTAIKQ